MVEIKGYKKVVKQLKDTKGYFARKIELKRLAKYSNEIDTVLTKYNKKSCDETMMVKGLRKSNPETTNRKIHQEDLENIVGQVAKKLDLNEEIVKIMGKHHDIGHTFLGHSGEWWISNILEDYGLGYFCHNTLGARELVYTHEIYDEIIQKIKVHNPNISPKILGKIRKSLWLIVDGINAHNGEKPEKEYIPNVHKKEEDFTQDMLLCYTKAGYDKKITPATPEACLMRLADQISYIPLDMLDGLREKMIRDENGNIVTQIDEDYTQILTKLGITKQEIDEANIKGTYGKIAERIKEILINDVIQNSTKRKITMSKEKMQLMNELRNLNNSKIVDNVILTEDQETYPKAIRILMNRYKDIILQNHILHRLVNANQDLSINEELSQYRGTPDEGFIQYICNTNAKDFKFTMQIVEEATKQSISDELDIARKHVQEGIAYKAKEEHGLEYDMKNARIEQYIQYYMKQLQSGELIGYSEERKQQEVEKIFNNIKAGKQNENYMNMSERMALSMAAKYISTLNDHEFIQLLQDTELIDDEKYQSLTRKYKDVDLKKEVYVANKWKEIKEGQKSMTVEEDTKNPEQK